MPRQARSRADGLARAALRDARMQPSAGGRLRAAGPAGPILPATISTKTAAAPRRSLQRLYKTKKIGRPKGGRKEDIMIYYSDTFLKK